MAVTSSGKIEIGVNIKGVDGTGKATKNAVKNIRGVEKAQKRAARASAALTKVAFRFNMITEAASKVFGAVAGVGAEIKAQAEQVASAERAFGSYDAAMQNLANAGGAMTIGTFSRFTNVLKSTGLEINLTQGQIDKMGSLAASMGKDSDEAFELFAKSVAKGNTKGLQALGIFANMEIELRNVAKASGRSTDSFTHQERQSIALSLALREVESAAVAGGEAFGQMDQLGRNVSNAWDSLMARTFVPLGNYIATNLNLLFDELGVSGVKSGIQIDQELGSVMKTLENMPSQIGAVKNKLEGLVLKGTKAAFAADSLEVGSETLAAINREEMKIAEQVQKQKKNKQEIAQVHAEVNKLTAQALQAEQAIDKIKEKATQQQARALNNHKKAIALIDEQIAKEKAAVDSGKTDQAASILMGQLKNRDEVSNAKLLNALVERRAELIRSHGRTIANTLKKQKDSEAAIADLEEKKEAIAEQLGNERERQAKISEAILNFEREHEAIVVRQLGLRKALSKAAETQFKNAAGTLQSLQQMLEADRARFGDSEGGLERIQNLEAVIFNMRREEARRENAAQRVSLENEKIKSDLMFKNLMTKRKEMKAEIEILEAQSLRLEMEARRWNSASSKGMQKWDEFAAHVETIKAQKTALKNTTESARATEKYADAVQSSLMANKALGKYLEGARLDTGKGRRRRQPTASRAPLRPPRVQGVDLQLETINLKKEALALQKRETDEERRAFILSTQKLDVQRQSLLNARARATIEKTIEEIDRQTSGRRRLTNAETIAFAKARQQANTALNRQEIISAQKLKQIRGQASKDLKDLNEEIEERFRQDLQAIQRELAGETQLDQARRVHVERLQQIAQLKERGLSLQKAETLEIKSQGQLRQNIFDQFGQNTQGAIQMALSMDAIVAKYSQMEGAAQQAGETSLTAGQQFVKSTAMFMQAVNQQSQQINDVITAFKEANEESGKGYQKAIGGAIAVGGKLAAAVIEDERTKAAILGASELAASFAAYPDPVGMTSHGIAAAMYFAIAGGAGKGKAAATETEPPQVTAQGGAEEQMQPGTTIININAPVLSGTGAETGAMLGEWMEGAKGAGFGI